MQPPISSPSHATYNTTQMEGPPRSPFEQGPPPSGGQPYAPHPQQQQPSPSQEGTASNQYPQYSYDIQLRYPHDQNRPYSQGEHRQYPPPPPSIPQFPQDVPRQYAPIQGQGLPLPSLSTMSMPNQGYGAPQEMPIDTTGQVAPAGMKPRVTATLWEDEGTLCFQVDVKGTCVARREGEHPICPAYS
jgi:protein SOK2